MFKSAERALARSLALHRVKAPFAATVAPVGIKRRLMSPIKRTKMTYSNYLPLINIETRRKFVLWGGWFTENANGTVTLKNGDICAKWENFPE